MMKIMMNNPFLTATALPINSYNPSPRNSRENLNNQEMDSLQHIL